MNATQPGRLGHLSSADEAHFDAVCTLRHGAPVYVWRLRDGSFAWTAIPNPGNVWLWRELDGSEMVEHFHTPIFSGMKPPTWLAECPTCLAHLAGAS